MKKVSGIAGAAPIWHEFMEGVLADETLRWTLGVGDDAAVGSSPRRQMWSNGTSVRPGPLPGRRRILQPGVARCGGRGRAAGRQRGQGAVGAGVRRAARWWAVDTYCRVEPAAVRPLLKLPDRLGLPDPTAAVTGTQPLNLSPDALHAIGWSLRHPTPVDLGPCDALAQLAPARRSIRSRAMRC